MKITLRQLTHARSLLRHGNFREAAMELNLTQSALTRSIQTLENSLGVTLFDRLPAGVEPTRAGESLLRQADEILLRSRELEREALLIAGSGSGSIRVSAGAYPVHDLVPRAVAACLMKAPGFSAEIIAGDWRDAVRGVLTREADLAVADMTFIADDSRLAVIRMEPQPIYFVCRPGHPLAGASGLGIADLCQFPLVGGAVAPHIGARLAGFPRAGSVDPDSGYFRPAIVSKSVEAATRIVMRSDGIAAAQLCAIESPLAGGQLCVLDVPANPLELRLGLIRLRDRVLSPMARLFLDTLMVIRRELDARDVELRRLFLPAAPGRIGTDQD